MSRFLASWQKSRLVPVLVLSTGMRARLSRLYLVASINLYIAELSFPFVSFCSWKLIETTAPFPFLSANRSFGRNLLIESPSFIFAFVLCILTVTVSYIRAKEERNYASAAVQRQRFIPVLPVRSERPKSLSLLYSTACLLTVYTTQSPLFVETLEAAKVCGYLYNVESSLRSIFVIRLSHRVDS